MTLTIELTSVQEALLVAAAQREGLAPALLAQKFVADQLLPAVQESDPLLALFAQWDKEDAEMTAEEVALEQQEWDTFKQNVNNERARAGARRVF